MSESQDRAASGGACYHLRVSKRVVFALVTIALVLVACEVGQRISDWRKRESRIDFARFRRETTTGVGIDDAVNSLVLELNDASGYRIRPNQRVGGVEINARGYRGRPMPDEKPPGELRVILLGGSSAYGYFVDEAESDLAAQLERRLSQAPPAPWKSVRVWNCGVLGYDSWQEVSVLASDLLRAAPDVVITFDGWNDFQHGGRTPIEAPMRSLGFSGVESQLARTNQPVRELLRGSAFFRGLERRASDARRAMSERAESRTFGVYAEHPDAIPRYRRNLTVVCRLARSYGARVLLVTQPEVSQRGHPIPERERGIRANERAPGYTGYATAVYPRFRDATRAVAEAEGASSLDATRLFDGRSDEVFLDDCHLSKLGLQIVAEALDPLVREILVTR